MQAFIGEKTIDLRLDPLSKKNRLSLSSQYDQNSFVEELFDRSTMMHNEHIQERRGSVTESIRLGHVFWEIGQDSYVKMSREKYENRI